MSNDLDRDLELTALCTPLLDAPAALEVLTDKLLEEGVISFDDPCGVNPPEVSKYRALEAALAWARERRGFHEKTPYLDQEGEYRVCVTDILRIDPRVSRLPREEPLFVIKYHIVGGSLDGRQYAHSFRSSPLFRSPMKFPIHLLEEIGAPSVFADNQSRRTPLDFMLQMRILGTKPGPVFHDATFTLIADSFFFFFHPQVVMDQGERG